MARAAGKFADPRVAVVTGGASGIGLALCRALAAEGWRLALLDCNAARLECAQIELSPLAPELSIHTVDVADAEQVIACREEVISRYGGVHLLVNCAGVSLAGAFSDTSLDDFDWVMGVNLRGTVNCCKLFLPDLLAQPRAHIVTVSSSFGLVGFPGKSGYAASKFAVRGFSESLRMELSATGVGVTVLYPGPVDTGIVREGRAMSESQRKREVSFLASRAIPVETVAKATLRGIDRNAARVILSWDYLVIDWLTRLAPLSAQRLIGYIGRRELG